MLIALVASLSVLLLVFVVIVAVVLQRKNAPPVDEGVTAPFLRSPEPSSAEETTGALPEGQV